MVFGVSDVENVADQFQTLRVVEGGAGVAAVGKVLGAGADYRRRAAVQVGDDDAVVVGVGDEQSVAGAVGEDFAGERQGGIGGGIGIGIGLEVEGAAVQHSFGVKLGNHTGEEVVEGFVG